MANLNEKFSNISRLISNSLDIVGMSNDISLTVVSNAFVIKQMLGELLNKYNFDAHVININEFSCDLYALTIDEDFVVSVEPAIKSNNYITYNSDYIYIDADLPYSCYATIFDANKTANICCFDLDIATTEDSEIGYEEFIFYI